MNGKLFSRSLHWRLALFVLAFVLPVCLRAQTAEGYDPMRQITAQIAHPNVMIAMDRSTSLAWPSVLSGLDRVGWDVDSYYNYNYHAYWRFDDTALSGGTVSGGTVSGYANVSADFTVKADTYIYITNNDYWDYITTYPHWGTGQGYWLRAENVVTHGNHGYSIWYFVPPSRMAILKNALGKHIVVYSASVSPTGQDNAGKDYYQFGLDEGPVGGAYFDWASRTWQNWDDTSKAPVPDSGYTTTEQPADLVGTTSAQVNWGLLVFSSALDDNAKVLQQVIPVDSNQTASVATIEGWLDTEANNGLAPGGKTPTSAGLDLAKKSLTDTYDYLKNHDTANSGCNRLYAVLLVTDGQSNNCNPGNTEWADPCSEQNLGTIAEYPPGRTDELFLQTADSSSHCTNGYASPVPVQTFVVGVSSAVSECELNLDAYFGRTDAYAVDAGVDWQNDPRLPSNTTGTTDLTHYKPTSNYAFFANTAGALNNAFEKIVAGMGTGNYTTEAPSVGASPSTTSDVGLLPSVEYPGWKGHLYAFDLSLKPQDDGYTLWDAGQVLEDSPVGTDASNGRAIYTWDSNNKLVEVTQGNLSTLQKINPKYTASLVDFIRGNNGQLTGTKRSWLLGAIINSTPAVIGAPAVFGQGKLASHQTFETNYASRHPLVWVGADDGMLHAFDIVDGKEILALLPPDQVGNEVKLYNNYAADPDLVTGQPSSPAKHIYGIDNSPRYADVNFGTASNPSYQTVLYLTEGPGYDHGTSNYANSVWALNVTHPYPGRQIGTTTYDPDFAYTATAPVSVVWGLPRTGELSWSVPAVGAYDTPSWMCVMGSGFNPANTAASGNTIVPKIYDLNAASGSRMSSSPYPLTNVTGSFVGNQAFAHSIVWQPQAQSYQDDNIITQGVQADLNGQIWFQDIGTGGPGTPYVGINLQNVSPNQPAPVYYSPAVGPFSAADGSKWGLYVFGSGSFYEQSPEVSGEKVGQSGYFIPTIYIVAKKYDNSGAVVDTQRWSLPVQDIPDPNSTTGGTLHPRAQITASPVVMVPAPGSSANPFALFLVYDPDSGECAGTSYLVHIDFDPANLLGTNINSNLVKSLGAGVASGFTMSKNQVYVAKSGVGSNAKASMMQAGPQWSTGKGSVTPAWWTELK